MIIAMDQIKNRSGVITLELVSFVLPALSRPSFDGSYSFTITGTENTAFVVETSIDLDQWRIVGAGVLTREPFLYQNGSLDPVPTRFFRVRLSD